MVNDFEETISHELNHLLHYGCGMKKRNDLYEKTKKLISLGKFNQEAYFVGLCCYYSFKHEQDAFAQQFYVYLLKNKPHGSFTFILQLSQYKNMCQCYKVLKQILNEKETQKAIKDLGYNSGNFLKLIHYRLQRFRSKISNVYQRYIEETQKLTIETLIKQQDSLIKETQQEKYNIRWSRESIFNFK